MTDEELAEALVAAGAAIEGNNKSLEHRFTVDYSDWMTNKDIVRDWRVAGAMMEKCWAKDLDIIIERGGIIIPLGITEDGQTVSTGAPIDASLPRAINEAIVTALEGIE